MSTPSKSEMKRQAIGSGLVTVAGFVLFLGTRAPLPLENFWAPYATGCNRMGLLMLIFGFLWCAISLGHTYSHFFDLDRPIDGNEFMASIVAIALLTIILLAVVPGRIPVAPPAAQPPDSSATPQAVLDRNLRRLAATGIFLSGLALVSVPVRRFIRH